MATVSACRINNSINALWPGLEFEQPAAYLTQIQCPSRRAKGRPRRPVSKLPTGRISIRRVILLRGQGNTRAGCISVNLWAGQTSISLPLMKLRSSGVVENDFLFSLSCLDFVSKSCIDLVIYEIWLLKLRRRKKKRKKEENIPSSHS